MQYDITFHPSWWHKNVGICFSQEFFDDPGYRMECDIKMRKALYERFGAMGLEKKIRRNARCLEQIFWQPDICIQS